MIYRLEYGYPVSFAPTAFHSNLIACVAGLELSQNDEWLGTTQQHVGSFLQAVKGVRSPYNPSFRWIAKYILTVDKDVKKAGKHRQYAADILRPILQE